MSRDLLILRHGKAFDALDGNDFERTLKDSGKRKAQRVGVWLQQQGLQPDYILASPAPRARVTAEKCCKAMGIGSHKIILLPALYLADTDTLIQLLRTVPVTYQRVMVVGHNPGLSSFTEQLSSSSNGVVLKKASLAHLVTEQPWSELDGDSAVLQTLLHAKDLPPGFPYPAPNGQERRCRPAYYYTQSAVIPYRYTDDGLKILVIRSSQNKHWVIPKGIADPGMTLQASAAKEAREEAGVEGPVGDEPLGTYDVQKWGANCTVTVFPMAVQRQLPDSVWEESHRGRRWMSPKQAAILLHQPELGEMARNLAERLQLHG